MPTRLIPLLLLLAAAPAIAQSRIATVQNSPFVPGTARAYDAEGNFVATIRDSPFIAGERRVYDASGDYSGIELRDSPFVDGDVDVYDYSDE